MDLLIVKLAGKFAFAQLVELAKNQSLDKLLMLEPNLITQTDVSSAVFANLHWMVNSSLQPPEIYYVSIIISWKMAVFVEVKILEDVESPLLLVRYFIV